MFVHTSRSKFSAEFTTVTAALALSVVLSLAACSASTGMGGASAPTDDKVNAQVGDITIRGAWARPTVAGDAGEHSAHDHGSDKDAAPMNSAAYMVIENKGAVPDRLLDVASDVAAMVQLHQTTMKDGVMKMEHLPDGAEIPAGGRLVLKPASYHIMLMGVQKDMAPGGTVKVTLKFERAGSVSIDVPVRQP